MSPIFLLCLFLTNITYISYPQEEAGEESRDPERDVQSGAELLQEEQREGGAGRKETWPGGRLQADKALKSLAGYL